MQAMALEDDYDSTWGEDALATIIGLSLAHQTFSSDDLRKAMRTPPRSSQYGAAFRNAQAAGLIEAVGYVQSTSKTRNNGSHKLWRRKREGVDVRPVIESVREREPHPVHIPEHMRGTVSVREPKK